MKKVTTTIRALWNDESAQGATEYILLLAIVVSIAVAFGPKIKQLIGQKMEEITSAVGQVKADGN